MQESIKYKLPLKEAFNYEMDGKNVKLFYLSNNSMQVAITNYGCRIVSLITKDKNDNDVDVVCGFNSIINYIKATEFYHGAIIGRYANRIANGIFLLNNKEYRLATNNNSNHLHGGIKGFHDVVWDIKEATDNQLVFEYLSTSGEEGYPGNLSVTISYSLKENDLIINFSAVTDDDTIINLTNHAYFNLNGEGNGTITNHWLQINADHYTPIDNTLIPTGKIEPVANTPFDFRKGKNIGNEISENFEQLNFGNGYDHNFVLTKHGNNIDTAAKAIGDKSGITLEVLTTEPGIQLYTGNFMKGDNFFKSGLKDEFRTAFCLETQHFPDSPNHKNFPTTLLRKGETFTSTTIFRLY